MPTPLDIDQIRSETPGVDHVLHLGAAGAALMPQRVVDAVHAHHELEAQIGGYEAAAARGTELDGVYCSVARLVNAKPTEIAVVENATVAWMSAFYALKFEPGDRVLTAVSEYGANYVAFLQRAKTDGIVIDVVPNDPTGALDLDALASMIDDRVKLIATTWIPTNGGLVNPAAGIGALARQHGIPFLLDACQAVGQMPVDVETLGCDFLSATGRKFLRGPRGTGFLYVSSTMLGNIEPAMLDHFGAEWTTPDTYELRPDARRFENWENSYALRAGLDVACAYALELGLDAIQERAWALTDYLRDQVAALPGAEIRDLGSQRCAIATFTLEGHEPRAVVDLLRAQHINIGASDPASTLIDATTRKLPTIFRASPHYYNTETEIDRFVEAISALDPTP